MKPGAAAPLYCREEIDRGFDRSTAVEADGDGRIQFGIADVGPQRRLAPPVRPEAEPQVTGLERKQPLNRAWRLLEARRPDVHAECGRRRPLPCLSHRPGATWRRV